MRTTAKLATRLKGDESCDEDDKDFECPAAQKYDKATSRCIDRCPGGSWNAKSEKCEDGPDCGKNNQYMNKLTGKCECPTLARMNSEGKCVCPINSKMNLAFGRCDCNPGFFPSIRSSTCVRSAECGCGEVRDPKSGKCKYRCSIESFSVWNPALSRCECPEKAYMPKGSTKCKCPIGYKAERTKQFISCTRVCKPDQLLNKETGKCQDICSGDGQSYNTGTRKCECDDNKLMDNGKCVCPKETKFDAKTKTCIPKCAIDEKYDFEDKRCEKRCAKGTTFNPVNSNCECGGGMTFSPHTNTCGCPPGKKPKGGKCVEMCKPGEFFSAKDKKCQPICGKNPDFFFDAASEKCVCKKGLVFNAVSEKCEVPKKPVKKCTETGLVLDNDSNKCVCDTKKHFSQDGLTGKCVCSNPYKINKTKDGCVFSPSCEADEAWDATKNDCVPRCIGIKIWNPATSKCMTPKCKDGFKYSAVKKACAAICDESKGQIWDGQEKKCVPKCHKAAGFVFNPSTKNCDKKCKPPRDAYRAKDDSCHCAEDKQWDEGSKTCKAKCNSNEGVSWCSGRKMCVSKCLKGEKLAGDKCVPDPGPKPPKPLKFDPTVNLNFSKECSYRGYYLSGLCYCPNTFQGDKCELTKEPGYNDARGGCDNFSQRYDSLFSIYPGYYPNGQDPAFLRNRYTIGKGKTWRGPIGNGWITMHSLVKKKFHVFNGNPKALDVKQGSYGNCYMLGALASIVSVQGGCLIKNAFLTHTDNKDRIYITRWYKEGKIRIVAVDDWVPAQNGVPTGVKPNEDDAFWANIMEKAWSKIHGSYRATDYGNMTEVFTNVVGAPNNFLVHRYIGAQDLFKHVCGTLARGAPAGAYTRRGVLDRQHCYGLIKCYTLKLSDGSNAQVIQHFNPYNQGSRWKANPFGDGAPVWTPDVIKQVENYGNDKDGYVFQHINDFKRNFGGSTFSEARIGYSAQFFYQHMIAGPKGRKHDYPIYFTIGKGHLGKVMFLWLETADVRHSGGCYANTYGHGWLRLYTPSGKLIKAKWTKSTSAYDRFYKVTYVPQEVGEHKALLTASRMQNNNWVPLSVYALDGEIKYRDANKNWTYDAKEIRSCGGGCPGLCNYYNGRCMKF